VNWYKLDVVRDVLRSEYDAETAPGLTRDAPPHLEIWRRRIGREVFVTFLNYESPEFLVPEEQLLTAAESLAIHPPRRLLDRVKARGGLWLGPSPS